MQNPLVQKIPEYWYLISLAQMLDTAREYLKEKLAKEPTLLLLIVGIPNVGKSALINTLYRLSRTSTSGEVCSISESL